MFAERELAALAERKLLLQARIAVRRMQCVVHGEELARPLALVDRVRSFWTQLSPLIKTVGIPVGLMLVGKLLRRSKAAPPPAAKTGKFAAFLGLLPIILQLVQAWLAQPRRGEGAGGRAGPSDAATSTAGAPAAGNP